MKALALVALCLLFLTSGCDTTRSGGPNAATGPGGGAEGDPDNGSGPSGGGAEGDPDNGSGPPGGGAGDAPDNGSESPWGDPAACPDPPSPELDAAIESLRTASHPECGRAGQGCPMGPCPEGCMEPLSHRIVVDVERECLLSWEQLGGPPFCDVEQDPDDISCTDATDCRLSPDGRTLLVAGEGCHRFPEGWSSPLPEEEEEGVEKEGWDLLGADCFLAPTHLEPCPD